VNEQNDSLFMPFSSTNIGDPLILLVQVAHEVIGVGCTMVDIGKGLEVDLRRLDDNFEDEEDEEEDVYAFE
jgi:hypothetical protein